MVTQPTTNGRASMWDEPDQRVVLHDVSWEDFEKILEIRGDQPVPRIAYLEGELEFMSPSRGHEITKAFMGRLLEAYAEEHELQFNSVGSWTIKQKAAERAIEPDQCYVFAPVTASSTDPEPSAPDLALEVEWTRGGLSKLEIYRKLRVREVWRWRKGQILVYALRGEQYEPIPRSELLPKLDLDLLASFLERDDQTQAVRAYRKTLRGESG